MSPTTYRKLQGAHVLVIGGSSGIGAGVSEAAAASGANVTISSSSQAKVDAAVARLAALYPSRTIRGIATDLSSPATVEADLDALFRSAQGQGTINHVVYTAADALSLGSLDGVSVDMVHAASHMRMVVPIVVAKTAARYLPGSHTSSITLTSGTVAERPTKGWAVVAYFGGGLISLARALAVDLAPVRVNVVRPGYVDTGLWGGMGREEKEAFVGEFEGRAPTGRFGRVEDVAEAYLWVMKDGNATGSVAGTDGGLLLV